MVKSAYPVGKHVPSRRGIIALSIFFSALCLVGYAICFALDTRSGATHSYLLNDDSATIRANLILPAPLEKEGLAHYVEHLTWLSNIGKNTRPADRHSNAWTNNLAIGYWLSGDADDLTDILRTLSGVFDPISVPRDFAEQEREVILREYDLRMTNNPDALAANDMQAFLYTGDAIAAPLMGAPNEIRALSFDEAKAYHNLTHRPEKATLVVSGNLSTRELNRAIRESGFPELTRASEVIAPPPFTLAAAEVRTFTYWVPDAAPRMIWRKVVRLDEPVQFDLLEARTALLTDILSTNLPGGIAGPLRFDAFIAKSFSVAVYPIDEQHIEISFFAEPDEDVTFRELRQAFETYLTNSSKGIPQATYQRVRGRFSDYWPDWTNKDQVAEWMVNYVLNRVSSLREPLTERRLRKLDSQIAAPDINALLAVLAGPGRSAIAFIGEDQKP